MKYLKSVSILCFLCSCLSLPCFAQQHKLGAGIVLGSPSALTVKYWLDGERAVDAGLAFALDEYVLIYSDYLLHFPQAFGPSLRSRVDLVPYVGIGGLVAFTTRGRREDERYLGKRSSAIGLGVRIPLGLEWTLQRIPLGIFGEIAPGLSVLPATDGFLQLGIGVRFYF